MSEEIKSLKQYCREAKKRLKSGFWEKYRENLEKELEEAASEAKKDLLKQLEDTKTAIEAELADIDLFGKDGRGHIANQRNIACIGQFCPACAVDGVIQCDIEIIRFGVKFCFIQCGDVIES